MPIAAFPNRPLTAIVLMRLIAMCALNLCSAKTVQSVLFDGQSVLLQCPKIQMRGDVFSIECWTCKTTDPVDRCSGVCSFALDRGIKQIGPENALRGSEQLRGQRSLAPAHHLGIEPGRLHRGGARGAILPDEEVALVGPRAAIRRGFYASFV